MASRSLHLSRQIFYGRLIFLARCHQFFAVFCSAFSVQIMRKIFHPMAKITILRDSTNHPFQTEADTSTGTEYCFPFAYIYLFCVQKFSFSTGFISVRSSSSLPTALELPHEKIDFPFVGIWVWAVDGQGGGTPSVHKPKTLVKPKTSCASRTPRQMEA